jgi:hypothetical protein
MTSNVHAAIDAAAAAIADAKLAAQDAEDALAPAVARRDVIAERIADLETERASILAARRNGHQDDDTHGPRLVLIAADVDDLAAMLTEADTEVAPLRQAHEEARRRVLAAEQTLVNVREDEVLRLTMTRANELGELLLRAVAAIDLHKIRLATQRDLWTPSKALAEKLNALYVRRVQEPSKC